MTTQNNQRIVINTDGSCLGNPGPGGYAAIVEISGAPPITARGGEPQSTNQRMELLAAIAGMELLNSHHPHDETPITLRSDSQYVVRGMTEWLTNWKRNGWRNASKKPVANRELWQRLDSAANGRSVTWQWVRGHAGDPMNERCDEIAVACANTIRATGKPFHERVPLHESAPTTEQPDNPYLEHSLEWLHGALHGITTGLKLTGNFELHTQIYDEIILIRDAIAQKQT